jgi:hypothetical protein
MNQARSTLDSNARWGIHDLHARYVIALDSDDPEAVASCFTEDSTFETHDLVFRGPQGIKKMLRHAPKGLHLGGHAVVEPAEFGATARQQLVFIDANDHSQRLALYDDEVVETAHGWRFRRRVCQFLKTDGSLSQNP